MKTVSPAPYQPIAHKLLAILAAFCIVNVPIWGLSASDASVTAGSANITGAANTVSVDLLSNRAVLDWTQMNATSAETLYFSGTSGFAVLNRVGSAVDFNGVLNGAGGHIFVISPHGVIIGPDAAITAAGFTASGLNITNPNFMNGTYQFVPFEVNGINMIGTVTNEGRIGYNPDGTPNPVHDVALLGSGVLNKGAILSDGGLVVFASGDEIFLADQGSNVLVELYNTPASTGNYNVTNDTTGSIENPAGTIVLAAGDTFAQAIAGVSNNAYINNTYTASQKGKLNSDTLEIGAANQADIRGLSTTLANAIRIGAKKVLLENTLHSSGTMIIDADFDINALDGLQSGETMELKARSVQVRGDIVAGSTARIEADTLYSRGDIITEDELMLMAESVLWGEDDQTIDSGASIKNAGAVSKITDGELYIRASEDVQLDGDVSAVGGGVSVIAENGKIHSGDGTDTLNIAISGYSNDVTDSVGVELPQGEGKAAIVLQSNETLKLGPDTALKADGFYLSANDNDEYGVDDRPGIDWLQEDGQVIGGLERDEGIASDVAIYVGSKTGNVEVATSRIQTAQAGEIEQIPQTNTELVSGPATVVFDAFDTVTMPELDAISQSRSQKGQESNFLGFRLEVSSRVTEWLHQAIQEATLPYADEPQAVEDVLHQDYVLRGAGLNNAEISNGRAWVLEDPTVPAAPLPDSKLPELKGCPAEIEAASAELDINADDLQLLINNSMATNPNLHPCDACARLLVAAGALRDEDGARLAALNQIFNTLAPAEAPFTREVSATIATAFANLADQDPQYALAADYIDSFLDYIAVLDNELKVPVGDPMVYTLNKYAEAIMSHPNQNIVAFLAEQAQSNDSSL